jgi:hypothetical protein
MVATQIILLSKWFSTKNLIRKTQSKRPTKKTQTKSSSPNRLVQNDTLVKLDMGAKKPYGGFFLPKFLVKKAKISYSVLSHMPHCIPSRFFVDDAP